MDKPWYMPTDLTDTSEFLVFHADYAGNAIKVTFRRHDAAGLFMPASLAGPTANPNIFGSNSWEQYLRRITTHACLTFGVGTTGEIAGVASSVMTTTEWLRLYHRVCLAFGLLDTGCCLSVGSMMMMLGKHDAEIAKQNKLDVIMAAVRCEPGTYIDPEAVQERQRDKCSGLFRSGTAIIVTDLQYRVQSANKSYHYAAEGLREIYWPHLYVIDIMQYKMTNRNHAAMLGMALEEAVRMFRESDPGRKPAVRVHVWLSMGFTFQTSPPYTCIIDNKFAKDCAEKLKQANNDIMRPILVSINVDCRFNGFRGGETAAKDLAMELRGEGVLVSTSSSMWRAMFAVGGNHWQTISKGADVKRLIWFVYDRYLFRQRVILLCSLNPTCRSSRDYPKRIWRRRLGTHMSWSSQLLTKRRLRRPNQRESTVSLLTGAKENQQEARVSGGNPLVPRRR